MRKKVPVTIVTGFLGAGKTTLLRYILRQPHGKRIAVVQNEFSEEMGIESPVIVDDKGEVYKEIYELPNGCICCSVRDDLVATLDNLLEHQDRFDYILVETTGVADPEPVTAAFWVDANLDSRLYLDGIVTLVDAKNVLRCLGHENSSSPPSEQANGRAGQGKGEGDGEGENVDWLERVRQMRTDHKSAEASAGLEVEAAKQIAFADCILVNKQDLLAESSDSERLEEIITSINPYARIVRCTRSEAPLDSLLHLRALETAETQPQAFMLAQPPNSRQNNHNHHDDHHNHNHEHQHDHDEHHELEHPPKHSHVGAPSHAHSHGHPLVDSVLLTRPTAASGRAGGGQGRVLSWDAVNRWIARMLWEAAAGKIYRCKGIFTAIGGDEEDDSDMPGAEDDDEAPALQPSPSPAAAAAAAETTDVPRLFALQGVGELFEIERVRDNNGSGGDGEGAFQSKFLFIGRHLDREQLDKGLEQCWAEAA
ncbi:unnamed protein product [Vitrella brassicaformis CCMP3155]|uniref:CobW C-terminal domain-containing protein n=2 Tax=Vitrella brassicaformis TaxID=1169539 RepID=A0A0G4F431_VITBC|nr:unnamed protein product [Vitrella brassicaformis CCMP3155]|eukprot:CEM06603.1 unnamed protein product [Vitrella brassicaformis CCMP3155]